MPFCRLQVAAAATSYDEARSSLQPVLLKLHALSVLEDFGWHFLLRT